MKLNLNYFLFICIVNIILFINIFLKFLFIIYCKNYNSLKIVKQLIHICFDFYINKFNIFFNFFSLYL